MCVVRETDCRVVAICADCHCTPRISLQILGWFTLESPSGISVPLGERRLIKTSIQSHFSCLSLIISHQLPRHRSQPTFLPCHLSHYRQDWPRPPGLIAALPRSHCGSRFHPPR